MYTIPKLTDSFESSGRPAYQGTGTVVLAGNTYSDVSLAVYYDTGLAKWVVAFEGQPYLTNASSDGIPPRDNWVAETDLGTGIVAPCTGGSPVVVETVSPSVSISPTSIAGVCTGAGVTLTATALNFTPTNYSWSSSPTGFSGSGASNVLTQNAPSVSVQTVYTVTVLATNGSATATTTATVTVNPIPAVSINPTTQTSCSQSNFTTIALSSTTPNTTFSWTRTNTGVLTGLAASGTGSISGALTNATGSLATTTFTITPSAAGCQGTPASATIDVSPVPTSTVGDNQTICADASATLLATVTNGTGVWSVVEGPATSAAQFSNTASPTATFTPAGGAGRYKLRWTVTSTPCLPGSVSKEIIIIVNPLPTLTFSSKTAPSTCGVNDGTIVFTTTNVPNGVYTLSYTGSGSSQQVTVLTNTLSLTGLPGGSYSNFALTSLGCTGSSAGSVSLTTPTPPNNPTTNTPAPACVGSPALTLTANCATGLYRWSTNETTASISVPTTTAGSVTYSVVCLSSNGCTSGSVSVPVLIKPKPAPPSLSASAQAVCQPDFIDITVTAGQGTPSVQITSTSGQNNSSPGGTGPFRLTAADGYVINATSVLNGCTSDAATPVSVQINAIPQPTLSASGPISCATPTVTLTAGGGTSYRFSGPNGFTQTGSTPTATVSTAGLYSVTVTNAGSCSAVTTTTVSGDLTLAAPVLTPSAYSTINLPILVTASGCSGTINWTVTGGTGVSSGNLYTLSAPGAYTLTATCTVGTCTSPAADVLLLIINPSAPASFAITSVNTISCTPIAANRQQVVFTPQYAGSNGQPITFRVVNETLPTTDPGPYTLQLYTDNPVISLRASQSGTPGEISFSYNWLTACGAPQPTNTAPTVINGIPNQVAAAGAPFSYNVPLSTFTDAETPLSLTLSATGVPNGLNFVGTMLTGTPQAQGVSVITITATDPGGLSASTQLQLTVGPPTGTPPPPTAFAIATVNTLSCTSLSPGQRQVQFSPQYAGTNGQPITFSVQNETAPTTAPGPYTLQLYTDNPIVTLRATQTGTPGEVTFSYNWLTACNTNGRTRSAETVEPLQATLLDNPLTDGWIRVAISGATKGSVRLQLSNGYGRIVARQTAQTSTAPILLWAGDQAAGLLFLTVEANGQTLVLKVVKP